VRGFVKSVVKSLDFSELMTWFLVFFLMACISVPLAIVGSFISESVSEVFGVTTLVGFGVLLVLTPIAIVRNHLGNRRTRHAESRAETPRRASQDMSSDPGVSDRRVPKRERPRARPGSTRAILQGRDYRDLKWWGEAAALLYIVLCFGGVLAEFVYQPAEPALFAGALGVLVFNFAAVPIGAKVRRRSANKRPRERPPPKETPRHP